MCCQVDQLRGEEPVPADLIMSHTSTASVGRMAPPLQVETAVFHVDPIYIFILVVYRPGESED